MSFAKHLQLRLIRRSTHSLGINCPSLQASGSANEPLTLTVDSSLFGETFVSA